MAARWSSRGFFEVDHVVQQFLTGTGHIENLQLL